ncbi:MAG TPA: hypothetical protein VGF13_01125 [Verrucomicrobiae bacterium]|jgi:hypothetical protein
MNPGEKQLDPLALAMISRCTLIVLEHCHATGGGVNCAAVTDFGRRFRELLRAGHCVCIRSGCAYTVPQVKLGEILLANAAITELLMEIIAPKGTQE